MNSRLDVHVAAYEGENIYDFDNEIVLTWYPKRIARVVKDPRAVLDDLFRSGAPWITCGEYRLPIGSVSEKVKRDSKSRRIWA
jgi:hypothetical protein